MRRLRIRYGRQFAGERARPSAVAQRVHFDPDLVLPRAQLERPGTARHSKVPVMAPASAGKFAFASNHEAAPPALVEDLAGGQRESELEHGGL